MAAVPGAPVPTPIVRTALPTFRVRNRLIRINIRRNRTICSLRGIDVIFVGPFIRLAAIPMPVRSFLAFLVLRFAQFQLPDQPPPLQHTANFNGPPVLVTSKLPIGTAAGTWSTLPDNKVAIVRELQSLGERVIFVGDGVNDAPALAAATVRVAMGAAGTDVALETADIALMADDLAKLPVAIRCSRRTLRIIKQNISLSLLNKGVFLVLAIGGWATLWMAVASDMGASLVVIVNGLRALRSAD